MFDNYKRSAIALLLFSFMLLNLGYSSGLQSVNVTAYLNNTLLNGQPIPPLQSASQVNWRINATFGGLAQNISAELNQTQMNYTDSTGITSTSANPLQILWNANPDLETYIINGSALQPVNVVTSNITLGTVSQSGLYSSATSAPQCSPNNFYTEWDFYVTTQKNYTQSSRNVVVGRVCFYQATIGYAQALPKAPISQLSSTIILTAGPNHESIKLNYNSTHAASADGLARAQWVSNHTSVTAAPPNVIGYFAVDNIKSGQWYVHDNATYSQWYRQLYSFAFQYIPAPHAQYGPSSVGLLSQNCGVVSTSDLTNSSVAQAVECMNATGKVYYSQANFYAGQIVSSGQNVQNYTTTPITYAGKPAIALSLPSVFVLQPRISLNLSGAFTGMHVPAGKPAIISVTTSSLNTFGVGIVVVQVENMGNSAALFNVSLEGCPGISTPSGVNYQLMQGEGEEISIGIAASNTSAILNEKCTLVVNDLNGGGSASAQVTITSGPGENFLNAISRFLHSL